MMDGKHRIRQAWHQVCSRLPVYFGKNATECEHCEVDVNRLPRHIAIIMDGNGRWATSRGLPRTAGHTAGVEALRGVIEECGRLGVGVLTIYAFSTENWKRSKEEVGALMGLLLRYFHSELDELDHKGVVIRILGELDALPDAQRQAAEEAMRRTANNTGLQLNIALNYGGRDELLRAARILARRAVEEGVSPEAFTQEDFAAALYTCGQPDVDLLIRTSGEVRLSNFLPYQTTYAEMMFVDTLWPDFTAESLRSCIAQFQARDRRFGGIKTTEDKVK